MPKARREKQQQKIMKVSKREEKKESFNNIINTSHLNY